jgi:hypothetical protein
LAMEPGGRGLGALSAGVGVYFGIVDDHVDVFTGGQDVVDAAEGDIVGRAVTHEDPVGPLGEIGSQPVDSVQQGIARIAEKHFPDLVAIALGALGIPHVLQPALMAAFRSSSMSVSRASVTRSTSTWRC